MRNGETHRISRPIKTLLRRRGSQVVIATRGADPISPQPSVIQRDIVTQSLIDLDDNDPLNDPQQFLMVFFGKLFGGHLHLKYRKNHIVSGHKI